VPEFRAALDAEGNVLIAGRLPDERLRAAVAALAGARFGTEAVTLEARLDPDLPAGWSVRTLAAIEALAELHSGQVTLRGDRLDLEGVSGNPRHRTR
jgi:OmpA-OmpF porin, OOP family